MTIYKPISNSFYYFSIFVFYPKILLNPLKYENCYIVSYFKSSCSNSSLLRVYPLQNKRLVCIFSNVWCFICAILTISYVRFQNAKHLFIVFRHLKSEIGSNSQSQGDIEIPSSHKNNSKNKANMRQLPVYRTYE